MQKKRITLIGSGNVATHLGRGLRDKSIIQQVFSRNLSHAQRLAHELGTAQAVSQFEQLATDSDIYIIAVSDDAIESVVQAVPDNGALWLHTAGSVGTEVFFGRRQHYGVLYPLQSFSRTTDVDWSQVPIFVEGNTDTIDEVTELARLLSNKVNKCDSDDRMMLHIAAVFVCNFPNYLWCVAESLLDDCRIKFDVLKPLIRSTVDKLNHLDPFGAQTGPAVRGDKGVMDKHLDMLFDSDRNISKLISKAIMDDFEVEPTLPFDMRFANIRGIAFDVDGVLTPSSIPMHPSGEPMRMVNIKDGYAIQLAVKLGLPLAIISGANVEAVRVRFEGLGMRDVYLGAKHKLPVFREWMARHGLSANDVIFVGDDIPDIPVMREAGMAVAPDDACPEVLDIADLVTPCRGGDGVARYLIENVLKAQGKWLNDEHAFGW